MRLIAALALLASLFTGAASAATGAKPSYFKLDNGLELVVVPDHRTAVVTHMIWYKVGSADEPAGKSGIAHFLEHLMFKGTKANPAGIFSQLVARIGGQENAFTSNDYTGYYQRISREHLARVMALEADRMTGLVLSDAVVVPERDVVLEEQNQRVANDPAAQLGEQVQAALYLNHPYGRPVIGWRPEIEKLNRQDALDFYVRYYTPANAVVVIVGDVEPEEAKALAEQTYGKVANRVDVQPRLRPQEPEPVAVRHVTLFDPRVAQPSLQRSYLVPSESTAAPGESEALEVLTHILANGSVSRLYQQLVVEKKVAASVTGWYHSSALDKSRFTLAVSPAAGVSLPQLEAALDDVLSGVMAQGVSAAEVERAKNRIVADWVYAQDSQMSLARTYGAALTTGSTVEQVYTFPERVKEVTVGAVDGAARRWLQKRRSSTGYLMRDEAAATQAKQDAKPVTEGKRS